MRASTIVMIAFAVVFGLLAVFVAQSWLNSAADQRMKALEAQNKGKATVTSTIVIAAKPLRYGNELTREMLKEIAWPADALPTGAFAKVNDVLKDGKLVVLSAVEQNEPLLAVKITGAGQRATLSALVRDGMKAVTIRVNDVDGVGGFVHDSAALPDGFTHRNHNRFNSQPLNQVRHGLAPLRAASAIKRGSAPIFHCA